MHLRPLAICRQGRPALGGAWVCRQACWLIWESGPRFSHKAESSVSSGGFAAPIQAAESPLICARCLAGTDPSSAPGRRKPSLW